MPTLSDQGILQPKNLSWMISNISPPVPVENLRSEILVVQSCPCRKLTLRNIDGAVRPELASPACDRQSGWYAGSARPCAAGPPATNQRDSYRAAFQPLGTY